MHIYFACYQVRPVELESDGAGGAFLSCWVKALSTEQAAKACENYVAAIPWISETVVQPAMRASSRDPHIERAYSEGACFELHTWPIEDTDGQSKH